MGKGKTKSNSSTNQEAYTKQGNNYQAGGNIYINDPGTTSGPKEEPKPKRLDAWQKVVGIIVGITAILTFLLFTIPEKMGLKQTEKTVQPKDSLFVSGIIRVKGLDKGIPNAWVTSDLTPGDTIYTTSDGTFELQVTGKPGQSIRIFTGAPGYAPRNEYHTLPKAIAIYLDKK